MNRKTSLVCVVFAAMATLISYSATKEWTRKSVPSAISAQHTSGFNKRSANATMASNLTTTLRPQAAEGSEIFSMHPTAEEFAKCTVIDANNDGNTFTQYYAESGGEIFDWPIYYVNGMKKIDADDWLITPAITLSETDNLYELAIDACNGSSFTTESFEICIGKAPTPEAMTTVVLDVPRLVDVEFETLTSTFGIREPGEYYVGIHHKSPYATSFRIMLRDLKVSYLQLTADAPLGVTDLKATPDPEGELSAIVEFTMPLQTVNGKSLPAENITATIVTPAETAEVQALPGAKVSKSVAAVSGFNDISVYVTAAGGVSSSSTVSVRCAIDVPVDPVVTSTVTPDNMSLHLEWQPVTTGKNGGVVVASQITYNVYRYVESTDESGTTTEGWLPVAKDLKECQFDFTATASTQTLYEFMVSAANSAGESDGSLQSYASARLGTPYGLPMSEDFSNMTITLAGYSAEYPDDTYNCSWGFATASGLVNEAGDYGVLACINQQSELSRGRMAFPIFCAKGKKDLVLNITAWIDQLTAPTQIYIVTNSGVQEKIGEIKPSNTAGWQDMKLRLPQACDDADWAYFMIDSYLPDYAYMLMIRSFSVRELLTNDLAITSFSSTRCRVGEPAEVSVTVTNYGASQQTLAAPTVRVYLSETEIATVEMSPASVTLAPDATAEFKGTFTLDKTDYVGQLLDIGADLCIDDDYNDNNTKAIGIVPLAPAVPVVSDLNGEANASATGINLVWSSPISDLTIEDFEAYEHGDYSNNIGEWINLDLDGKNCYTAAEVSFPDAGLPKAFQVINGAALGGEGFDAPSGQQFLVAFSAEGGLTDDWLISPQLDPSEGFSFLAQIFHSGYPETIEILASSTDTDLDSFSPIQTIEMTQLGWYVYSFNDLPADTKYVAIHYCSNDQFGVMIDRITYKPIESAYELKGFNVYRNDTKIADRINTCGYEDIDPGFADNRYNVTVVATRKNGTEFESPMSNTLQLSLSGVTEIEEGHATVTSGRGCIMLHGFAPAGHITVSDISGRSFNATLSPDGTITIPVAPGAYIITACGNTYKVIVR